MSELDLQNELRGRIFARLVAVGVRRISLESSDFYEALNEPGDYRDFEDVFCDMMIWLHDEGLVRFDGISNSVKSTVEIDFCQITSLGLAVSEKPIGTDNLPARQVATSDTTEGYAKLGAFLGSALGNLAKAF